MTRVSSNWNWAGLEQRERLSRQRANERARELLHENLDARQREDLAQTGSFTVRGSMGGLYVIQVGRSHEVIKAWPPPAQVFGFFTSSSLPQHDAALAKKLSIEADEALARYISCRTYATGKRRRLAWRARRRYPLRLPWLGPPQLPAIEALDLRKRR